MQVAAGVRGRAGSAKSHPCKLEAAARANTAKRWWAAATSSAITDSASLWLDRASWRKPASGSRDGAGSFVSRKSPFPIARSSTFPQWPIPIPIPSHPILDSCLPQHPKTRYPAFHRRFPPSPSLKFQPAHSGSFANRTRPEPTDPIADRDEIE